MSERDDASDAGVLLAWASRPRETPARNAEYHRVVSRYRNEPDFATLVDAMFGGAGLSLFVDERDGALVTAEASSPLRVTISEITKRANQTDRAVIGGVLLMIARTAYPEPSMLDDPERISVFTVQSVVEACDRAAEQYAESAEGDGPADEKEVEVWRQWLALNPVRPNAKRRSKTDRAGVVNKVCRFLSEEGYLTYRGATDGGTWATRARFRHAVAALCADSELYRRVNQLPLVDHDGEETR
ncbi:hypothetical protein CDG81_13015 [Actinopolyspora erythraea]|uniref:Uncharacterized protein n=1 Tax=Actinopolyspora erythraea TaxID=414996 RepID=A0A099D731_9ACTN|nr:hypothetical protein [Actinopolyspora erythraea]ASU79053.1 hypothetical protein CDG81_13015 [Actinopolyspora erythraea]KGI81180.1 hypothetical protein IL38_13120 [Actinopolyspora erythraea]